MIIKSLKHKGSTVKISTDQGSCSFETSSSLSFENLEHYEINTLDDLLKLPHELHLPLLGLHEKKWKLIKNTTKIPRPLVVVLEKSVGIREFLLVSYDAKSFSDSYEAIEDACSLFYKKLKRAGYTVKDGVLLDNSVEEKDLLMLLKESVEAVLSEYSFTLRLGVAFHNYNDGRYVYANRSFDDDGQVSFVRDLVRAYDIGYVEAPFYETQLQHYKKLKEDIFQNCLVCYTSKIKEFTVGLFEECFSAVLLNYHLLSDFRDNIEAFREHDVVTAAPASLRSLFVLLGYEIVLARFLFGDRNLVKSFKKAEISLREGVR